MNCCPSVRWPKFVHEESHASHHCERRLRRLLCFLPGASGLLQPGRHLRRGRGKHQRCHPAAHRRSSREWRGNSRTHLRKPFHGRSPALWHLPGSINMTQKPNPRLVRADDFVAEWLEKRAKEIPDEVQAEHCKRLAKLLRESGRTGMLRVWEVPERK